MVLAATTVVSDDIMGISEIATICLTSFFPQYLWRPVVVSKFDQIEYGAGSEDFSQKAVHHHQFSSKR